MSLTRLLWWRKPKGPRIGRLKVVSGTDWCGTMISVVPLDGGEPIFLPVSRFVVTGSWNNYVLVDITAKATEIDLAAPAEGLSIRGTAAAVGKPLKPPQVGVTDTSGNQVKVRRFVWTWEREQCWPKLYWTKSLPALKGDGQWSI